MDRRYLTLVSLIVLLTAGEVYLFYRITVGPAVSESQQSSITGGAASTTPPINAIGPGSSLQTISGTVQSLSNSSLVIAAQSGAVNAAVTSQTQIVLAGQPKSQQTFTADLKAYDATLAQLLKNPEENKEAIATLAMPLLVETAPLALSDLAAGDSVVATVAPGSGNTFEALRIMKVPPAATPATTTSTQ